MTKQTNPRLVTAENILRPKRPLMEAIFAPGSIAVVGASETAGSVGQKLMENMRPFPGIVYPVNPKRASVFGITAFPTIAAIGQEIDLAVIATPARSVPELVRECSEAGVKGAIIISAGFKECGPDGADLERQIAANRGRMRIIGPNCLGVMVPRNAVNATFAKSITSDGNVAFLSQSGALCSSILDWSVRERVGFSAFVSTGSMVDVNWGDLIYYLGDDFHTRSILIYMESIGDARSLLSAAREVALSKPIIVLKVGRTTGAARAVVSHTGSLTGSDEALEAAFRRAGVLRVDTIEELFGLAEVLANQPRPPGPRLAIVTNGGGPGALAVDALITAGGELAQLSETTLGTLDSFLPPFWSKNNPVDLLGDADAERFAQAVQAVGQDRLNDGVLVILTPQAMTQPVETADKLRQSAKLDNKPILACWMGGNEVAEGVRILREAGIPTFPYPDAAAQTFCTLARYNRNLSALYETPALRVASTDTASTGRAKSIIEATYAAGRVLLTEVESKELLEAYEIPTVPTLVASTEDEAVSLAASFGDSVVLKVFSPTITHKSDVGGVKLDLRDSEAVRQAYRAIEQSVRDKFGPDAFVGVTVQPMVPFGGYEIILGSATDPQLGPVMVFGSGGQLVEVTKDRALGLPPLNLTLAQRLVEQCKIYRALKGVRGRESIDFAKLYTLLIRFSRLVAEQRRIKEIDINPLLASPKEFIAVDARVVLHDPALADEELPKLAIRPYPTQYIFRTRLKDGTAVTLRPICPEDEPLVAEFHKTLSEETVQYRYFAFIKLEYRIAHSRLMRICFNDYDCEIALVVERKLPETGERQLLGIGRLIKSHGADEAEFAIVISDHWQGKGLGTDLLSRLLEIGRQEKISRVVGYILTDNIGMRRVCEKLGFTIRYDTNAEAYRAVISLPEHQDEKRN
ncbi:MAG: bifunctional acetate--CoA ligase family protein/GNAT family N-acetyltransferase [Chthoniobacterales bacterium]